MVWLWMQFPLPQFLQKRKTIDYLHKCDLCSGTWIYFILAYFMQMDLLSALGFWYVPVICELVTGGVISFLVHIFVLGWREKFSVIIV